MEGALIEVQPHYSVLKLDGMDDLRRLFPDGKANALNFVLFSTSGVHGSYTTIEEAVKKKDLRVTVLVCHPRIVCMRYATISFELSDVPFLKKLRSSSWQAVYKIGRKN